MHPEMEMLRCAIMRGGTSKGVYIMMNQYPKDAARRDAVVLAIYGSPDVRQIDGLGGADVLTSKHAIISPSAEGRSTSATPAAASRWSPKPRRSTAG